MLALPEWILSGHGQQYFEYAMQDPQLSESGSLIWHACLSRRNIDGKSCGENCRRFRAAGGGGGRAGQASETRSNQAKMPLSRKAAYLP
jgi:hypothetical protein